MSAKNYEKWKTNFLSVLLLASEHILPCNKVMSSVCVYVDGEKFSTRLAAPVFLAAAVSAACTCVACEVSVSFTPINARTKARNKEYYDKPCLRSIWLLMTC